LLTGLTICKIIIHLKIKTMLGFFNATPEKKLQKKYDRLMNDAFKLSRINRKLADEKYVEAAVIQKKIEQLQQHA